VIKQIDNQINSPNDEQTSINNASNNSSFTNKKLVLLSNSGSSRQLNALSSSSMPSPQPHQRALQYSTTNTYTTSPANTTMAQNQFRLVHDARDQYTTG
jgi:uncharacterized membrane protein